MRQMKSRKHKVSGHSSQWWKAFYKKKRVNKARMMQKFKGAKRVYTNSKGWKTKIISRAKGQVGRETSFGRKIDKRITALPPGRRETNWGTTYSENRINRSDISRTRKL